MSPCWPFYNRIDWWHSLTRLTLYQLFSRKGKLMQGRTAIANVLKQEGVEYLFCYPNNPLIDACADAGIRPIIGRMERASVNMADGFTRISNGLRNGVCAVQHGPGIENAFPGVAQAYADSVPILILPGHSGRNRLGTPSDFSATINYRHVTKWAEMAYHADRIPEVMSRAFTCLRSGRPRPVMVEVPADVATEEIDEVSFFYKKIKRIRTAADPQDIKDVAQALLKARVPLIYAGQGVLYADATNELVELSELLQAPVMTTTLGKSGFPENHNLSLGTGGNSSTKAVSHFLNKADLVFGIGTSFQTTLASAPVPPGKVMIQATIDEHDLNTEYRLDYALLGDAKLVIRQLIEELKTQGAPTNSDSQGSIVKEIEVIKGEWFKEWMPRLTSNEVPINPYRVVWELVRNLNPNNTIITHDSGNPRDQLVPFYNATSPRGYLGWGNSTQLGYGMGLAMGAKVAAPSKLVVNLMGDAAVGMAGMDFETAVREQIPVLTIVMNNSAMGGYEKNIPLAVQKYKSKRLSGEYAKIAEAQGRYAEKVEQPHEIAESINRAKKIIKSGHPAMIEIITREDSVLSKFW